jgi:hypothetical protein
MSLPRWFHFDLAQTGPAGLSRGIRAQLRRIKSLWNSNAKLGVSLTGLSIRMPEMFEVKVPRYTCYPTAPHFRAGIGSDVYLRGSSSPLTLKVLLAEWAVLGRRPHQISR